MARSTSAALPPFFLLVVVACLSSGTWAKYYYYDFANSLQVWNSNRGAWRWANVQSLDTILPAGPDGFAVMDSPGASDELYTPWFTAPNGGKLAIKFYLRSEYVGSNDLTIKIYTDKNTRPVVLLDLEKYSLPDTKQWFVDFAEMEPQSTTIRLEIFCFNGKRAKPGEPLMGCAIDTLSFESYEDPTTTLPPTFPTSTITPTTLTPTAPPTTIPPTNPPTTNPPTTTLAPTTEAPSGPLVFDFQEDTDGWSLIQMNNAAFGRVRFQSSLVDAPPAGPWVLQVFQDNIQSGTVVATSPVLEAVDTEMKISITFWMDGTVHYPAQLKIRRRFTFSAFEETPVMNLDPFGNQINQLWLTYNVTLSGLTLGQTFSLILEASQGGDPTNAVVINRLEVSGVRVKESDFTIMNFENGLMGWSIGNMDGGLWQLVNWTTINSSLKVPRPPTGDMFLLSSRNHIYSGVLSIESPLLPASGGTTKRLQFKFWVRGSVTYPAVLSIRKKTPDGRYDSLPFVNLRSYGNIDSQSWLSLQRDVIIPLEDGEFYYQLVVEVDLGGRNENLVGIDDLTITTI